MADGRLITISAFDMDEVRGGVKKVVLLGGAPHKGAFPPPPPALVVVKVPLFCDAFFICLEFPDTEK